MNLTRFITKKCGIPKAEAVELISSGRIKVNNLISGAQIKINRNMEISLDNHILQKAKTLQYIAFYKPVGVESTMLTDAKNSLGNIFRENQKLFPVGRLDKASEGLLLMTNDGELYKKITGKHTNIEKIYLVVTREVIGDQELQHMREGITIMGKTTLPAIVKRTGDNSFLITLKQGLNRQIRRMCYKSGLEVTLLRRISIGKLTLGQMTPGMQQEVKLEDII